MRTPTLNLQRCGGGDNRVDMSIGTIENRQMTGDPACIGRISYSSLNHTPLATLSKGIGKGHIRERPIVPLREKTSVQKRPGMARAVAGFHSFACHPRIYARKKPKLILIYRHRRDGRLSWLQGSKLGHATVVVRQARAIIGWRNGNR